MPTGIWIMLVAFACVGVFYTLAKLEKLCERAFEHLVHGPRRMHKRIDNLDHEFMDLLQRVISLEARGGKRK